MSSRSGLSHGFISWDRMPFLISNGSQSIFLDRYPTSFDMVSTRSRSSTMNTLISSYVARWLLIRPHASIP